MKVPYSWLAEWVDVPWEARELGSRLTMAGFELDALEPAAPLFSKVVVAEIVSAERHPQADKLQVCRVSTGQGGELLQIVCGAPNARAGLKTALAMVALACLVGWRSRPRSCGGAESAGMLCSAKELGLSDSSAGIIEFAADAPLGLGVREYLELDDSVLELNITANRGDAMSIIGIAREVAALAGGELTVPGGLGAAGGAGAAAAANNGAGAVSALDARGTSRGYAVDARDSSGTSGAGDGFPVFLDAPAACPTFVGCVIRGVNNKAPTPLRIRERLRRAGVRSISPVVDVTNYVMLELGQPMHAYDLAKLQG